MLIIHTVRCMFAVSGALMRATLLSGLYSRSSGSLREVAVGERHGHRTLTDG
jgi:hypothetical protein